jgi:2,5-furandicarboxylate decarboxylase 1
MPMEVVLFKRLVEVGGNVNLKDVVALPYAGGSHIIVIQLVPDVEGQVRDVLMAALSSPYIHPKIAIAVDEDVDPHDPKDIFWSISTRVNPKKDVFVIHGCRGHHLDASAELITSKDDTQPVRIISKMGIDATKPTTRTNDAREFFKRSAPMGLGKVLLKDYL